MLLTVSVSFSQIKLDKNKLKKAIPSVGSKPAGLTNDEVIQGLKEALTVGTNNSSGKASQTDGYNANPLIHIPFPSEAQKMENSLRGLGMNKQVDDFILTLNRAAEEAAKEAAPVFIAAVKGMSIGDGFAILKGADTAATHYLKDKTTAELKANFKPKVAAAIEKVKLTSYWNPLVTRYNKIPMVTKVNPDLEEYVTLKAIEGLFKLVAEEEAKIRKDPAARVSDILKKVFG